MSLHLVPDIARVELPEAGDLLKALPFAAYVTDAGGRITAFNEEAAALWGREPVLGEELWCGSHKLFWPDGRAMTHGECPMAEALKTGATLRGIEAMLERPDGSRVPFMPYPTIFRSAQGAITGGLNILIDLTERLNADRTNAHIAAIVESSDDAIISKGLDGVIRSWNKGAERIFGYQPEEVIGQHVSILIPEDRLDEEPEIIGRISNGERIDHYETIRRRKDGALIHVSLTVSPVKNNAGQVVGASKIARDVTEKVRAEETQKLLLQEIKHRVKNTLGTVQAIAAQTFREGPKVERDAFAGRLRALSSAHDVLTQEQLDQVPAREISARALAPFQENRQSRFELQGADVTLGANQALLLAMALHELATNAVKYGALSNDKGQVAVSWQVRALEDGRHLSLEWRENGGPLVAQPARKGFGSTLIERALQQEQGRSCFDFRPEGVVCSLEFKL